MPGGGDWSPENFARIQGSPIGDESVPGTRLFYAGTDTSNRVLLQHGEIAMLLFYLPIILFEVMLEAQMNKDIKDPAFRDEDLE
jgi:hypothetical protein